MSTLLLRLAAPLQSWGVDSIFEMRTTDRAPSKSGVIGLCAAAMGIPRNDEHEIKRLIDLKFGVRIDKPGYLLKDFHMAHKETFWDGDDRSKINKAITKSKKDRSAYVTTRHYLSDAAFLVGLEGSDEYLQIINNAIHAPVYPLYLGRRSCPPEGQVSLGVKPYSLLESLKRQKPVTDLVLFNENNKPRIVIDAEGGFYTKRDLPASFSIESRQYGYRFINEVEFDVKIEKPIMHDAMVELEKML
jgi:CRISPR system Cascade subunit CasD